MNQQSDEFWRGFRFALAMGRKYIDDTHVLLGEKGHTWMMGMYDGQLDWADKEQYKSDENGKKI